MAQHLSPVPEVNLSHGGRPMPVLGFGTGSSPPLDDETTKRAILQAIQLGYRHFDTAAMYRSESPLGEAINEALRRGLIASRGDLFITSKLWCSDAHREHVIPALRQTLEIMKLEYIDLFLIHWPVSYRHGVRRYPIEKQNLLPMDFKSVWAAMEEGKRLGLTKAIGVSNFSIKKLSDLIAIATIPPAVNQVEVNPCWQQKKLIQFCKANGTLVVAYSPLGAYGAIYGTNGVIESELLKEIAEGRGVSVAQVSLRWAYEQGIGVVVRSSNAERMKQNLQIFTWELHDEERKKIDGIAQIRGIAGLDFISEHGPYKTVQELWDDDS